MKIKSTKFLISAVRPEQYPDEIFGEIAFAGRSNVGKSSLINMLINRKKLAKTSSTPGKTQTINFYEINEQFRFADLPGYGYAKVSKSVQSQWGKIIESYLYNRKNLLEVFQLVDIRHEPTQQDQQMYDWIKHFGFRGIVIATKSDKISMGKRSKQLNKIRQILQIDEAGLLLPASVENKEGKDKIWELIVDIFQDKGINIETE
jgi:GTP-binding protein